MAKTVIIVTPLVPVINQHIYPTIVEDLEAIGCKVIQTDKQLRDPGDPMEHAKLMLDTLEQADFAVYLEVMRADSWVASMDDLCARKDIPSLPIGRSFLMHTPKWRQSRLDYFINHYAELSKKGGTNA